MVFRAREYDGDGACFHKVERPSMPIDRGSNDQKAHRPALAALSVTVSRNFDWKPARCRHPKEGPHGILTGDINALAGRTKRLSMGSQSGPNSDPPAVKSSRSLSRWATFPVLGEAPQPTAIRSKGKPNPN